MSMHTRVMERRQTLIVGFCRVHDKRQPARVTRAQRVTFEFGAAEQFVERFRVTRDGGAEQRITW